MNRLAPLLALSIFCRCWTVFGTVDLIFPTENELLLTGDLNGFYQPTISKRAVSGRFGFVRTNGPEPPKYLERFHEGIDIRPLRRDSNGVPLDPVLVVADGSVVYVNSVSSRSNYGKYAIVQHSFDGWPVYTFYTHLGEVSVSTGQSLKQGDRVGILGYTGRGITKGRAHLHFEVTFRIQDDFTTWFEKEGKAKYKQTGTNHHGDYSGLAFLGVDPTKLLLASSKGESLSVPEIFKQERVQFKVRVPSEGRYWYWQKQFPFMVEGGLEVSPPPAWEISCNRIGIPLYFKRLEKPIKRSELSWFRPNLSIQEWFTRGLIQGRGGKERLSKWGRKWISQLTWPD
ncbi:MAG: M23 family metallopeptidase [Verrucomicrobiota bacterium]